MHLADLFKYNLHMSVFLIKRDISDKYMVDIWLTDSNW